MIRCANCGAERDARDAAECSHCGLVPAEAERAMRRKLVNHLGIFLLGSIAFFVPCALYPPLELDGVLIFMGVVFFLAIVVAIWAERNALHHKEVEVLKRVFRGFVPIPWLLGALLFFNGSFDRSPPQDYTATVISRFSMPGLLPMHQLVVTSWRDGRELERLSVSRQDFDHFQNGDTVDVRIEYGLLGVPWVYGVYHH